MSTDQPQLHPLTSVIATQRVSKLYLAGLGIAQFGIFIAILSPIFVSMQLKAQELNPSDPASIIGTVLPIGALGALISNPLFGALSDRTRTRWGRRKPWLLGGIVGLAIGLGLVAGSTNVLQITLAWLVCQIASNAASAALVASFADNVPIEQRGRASSIIAIAQNVSILAGIYLAVYLIGNLPVLFLAPGVLGVLCVVMYVLVSKDVLPTNPVKPFTFVNIISSFWTNPVKNPDFAFAWWSRFLITFSAFMFTTYRFFYMQDRIGLSKTDAAAAVAFGVLLYTIALLISSLISGYLSDRVRRRKIFVAGSTFLFAIGLIVLAHSSTLGVFYTAEIVMGFAYGIYTAVDTALVVDVLPNADRPGKDLGVINIANALPQSLAPAVGLILLKIGSSAGENYTALIWGAGIASILGALVIIPIKRVR